MLDEASVERVRQHLLALAREEWNPSRPLVPWYLRWFIRPEPPTQTCLVIEFAASDREHCWCTGDILRAWRLMIGGTTELDPRDLNCGESVDVRSPVYKEACISFHFDPEERVVVWTEIYGPRFGSGIIYDVRLDEGRVDLSVSKRGSMWIS